MSSRCPRGNCGQEENVLHLFWRCAFSQGMWRLLGPWLGELYRTPSHLDILYGELQNVDTKKWERWRAVMNCVKDAVWRSRNLLVFKKCVMSPESVVHLSLTLVKDYILRDKQNVGGKECKNLWKIRNDYMFSELQEIM